MFSGINNIKTKLQDTDKIESTAQKSTTNNTTTINTITTPVEAGKPRKFKNLVIRVKSKLNEFDKKKWDSSNSSSTITSNSGFYLNWIF